MQRYATFQFWSTNIMRHGYGYDSQWGQYNNIASKLTEISKVRPSLFDCMV